MTRSKANKLIEAIKRQRESAHDATASDSAVLYPTLKCEGALIACGTRINWNGTVKKAAVDLWDTTENTPDHAPALWADLNYKDGCRIIPEILSVSTAFAAGEVGYWAKDGCFYESTYAGNVYTPDAYPSGWKKIEK